LKLKEGKEKEVQSKKERNIVTFSTIPVLLHPKSKGTIRLQSSDPFDPPLIDPNYLDHPDDVKTLLRGLKILK
jgi:choline dehydrogenase-like flavoprotein